VLTAKSAPTTNRLLTSLAGKDRQHLLAGCEQVELVIGTVLSEPGERISSVYFPTSSFISMVTQIDDHAKLEVGLVGDEGMFGTPLVLGVAVSSMHTLVQGSGSAWRIDAAEFRTKIDQSPGLRLALERYIYVLMSQLAQMAVCTRFHVAEERLARWLLMTSDRAHSPKFHITHEFLAFMLGVRRVGITKAAGSLQKQKFISYSRGDITIIDRAGLEAASCDCYQADKDTYERILNARKISSVKEVAYWTPSTNV
jgi:CRP-like cAMP-binding protein